MYRQRKRDLNLKPNRVLDKRSSRGMIYENEELRMRTIAICEDVDRGQSDIKKLRKENDHLKMEIWGLRDECEKLEEMLKKVCISANIPEITLDLSSKNDDESEEDEDDGESSLVDEGDIREYRRRRKRRGSGTSTKTFDSEVGSCITSMFGDNESLQYQQQQQQQYQPQQQNLQSSEEIAFADEDPGSVIMNPGMVTFAPLATPEPEPGPSSAMVINYENPPPPPSSVQIYQTHPHPPWSHPTAVPPDLEAVKEESESVINSPISSPSTAPILTENVQVVIDDSLPDPNLVILSGEQQLQQTDLLEGRKTPVIHITPASSPNSSNGDSQPQSLIQTENINTSPNNNNSNHENAISSTEPVQTLGCITVVPKTFKVTSEIVVGTGEGDKKEEKEIKHSSNPFVDSHTTKSEVLPRKGILTKKQDSDPTIASDNRNDEILWNQGQRRSCYYPGASATIPQTPVSATTRVLGYCCCNNNDMILGGYQSEPSLNSMGAFISSEEPLNFFNAFCCRAPPPATPPLTLRSVWNTVYKNIVIGFYGYSTSGVASSVSDSNLEPKVQEIIDELESRFDPTLENILGIRLIPGRIFISLKNATVLKAFLQHFKNDLILQRPHTNTKIRIHFIEGATAKLSITLVLSGIPPELSDLAVISTLNQFGQVVAPLERRNYKGIDISERIAKMHLVINESSIPESVNVSGYEVRIRVETNKKNEAEHDTKLLTQSQQSQKQMNQNQPIAPQKYGFVPPTPAVPTPIGATLKPHKPVTRSSSSAPRLETPAPNQMSHPPFPTVEQKRHTSVCVGNLPPEQHPSKLVMEQQQQQASSSSPNLPQQQQQQQMPSAPAKKPLARLLVSSPGSVSPLGSPQKSGESPFDNVQSQRGGGFKGFCKNFDPRRSTSGGDYDKDTKGHAQLTPSSSYSPRTRRKSSVQFAHYKGKREPLPWCGCWGLGCG